MPRPSEGITIRHLTQVEWGPRGAHVHLELSDGSRRSAFVPTAAVKAARRGAAMNVEALPTDGGRPFGRLGSELAARVAAGPVTSPSVARLKALRMDDAATEILDEDLQPVNAPRRRSSGFRNALGCLALGGFFLLGALTVGAALLLVS
ncbi:MAG: hypothetical protein KTR31_34250 [Myxococcales bacterium]|nr:hypothetical protein [Myxococcales bacterium]